MVVEIDGVRLTVEGWAPHNPEPPGPIDVSGERHLVRTDGRSGPAAPRTVPIPSERAGPVPAAPAPGVRSTRADGPGVAVRPPMPGRLLEVRVREGESVEAGQVLIVLEAMKMRNEIASPVAGTVRELRAAAGALVRANELLLRVVPEASSS